MRCCLGPVEKGRIVLYSDLGEVMLKLDTVADQKKKNTSVGWMVSRGWCWRMRWVHFPGSLDLYRSGGERFELGKELGDGCRRVEENSTNPFTSSPSVPSTKKNKPTLHCWMEIQPSSSHPIISNFISEWVSVQVSECPMGREKESKHSTRRLPDWSPSS